MRLNALLKSIDSKDTADSGTSKERRMLSQHWIRKWFVPLPFIPPYWFCLTTTSSRSLSRTKDSRIFDRALVQDRFRSLS